MWRDFKSILFLNSETDYNCLEYILKLKSEKLVLLAADGAAMKMKAKGYSPDIIVGDLDSLKAELNWQEQFKDAEIICDVCQETNDFEKALRLVAQRNLAPCVIVGMQGGDLEHSYNNWSVFIKLSRSLELFIIEGERQAVPLHADQKVQVCCEPESLISLIPQPKCCLSSSGLKWQLSHEILELGSREGARNISTGNEFLVSVHSGSLLLFLPVKAVWKIQ